MTQEAYVSFEVAKLLNEKGFEAYTHMVYKLPSQLFHTDKERLVRNYNDITKGDCTEILAPTHQMAMAWLRERNIGITPEIHITQNPKDYHWSACIFHLNKSWDILHYISEPSKNVIDGYDDVIEQALKYILENLL